MRTRTGLARYLGCVVAAATAAGGFAVARAQSPAAAATATDIPALAAQLADAGTTLSARLALQAMPGSGAGEALRAAVGSTSGLVKVGIIDSLGARREVAAVATLTESLRDSDPLVAGAAAVALGKIGTAEAAAALAGAAPVMPAAALPAYRDGCLLCADRLAAAGNTAAAAGIYRRFAALGEPRAARLAALQGLLATAGAGKERLVLSMLVESDDDVRTAGMSQLGAVSTPALLALAGQPSGKHPAVQAAVLALLADRGEPAGMRLALEAAGSDEPLVRQAACEALGRLGDASAVPALVTALAVGDPAAATARRSLERIRHPAADDAIIAALRAGPSPERRDALVAVLLARQARGAVPLFFEQAAAADPATREAAIGALGRLATPADLPALVALLVAGRDGPDRDAIEKAIMFVAARIPDRDRRADAVLAAAGGSGRLVALPVLGRIGGQRSLALIRAAIADGDGAARESGVRALANWPDATVADELLALARSSPVDLHRQWALRAFVRVISLPGDVPPEKTLARLVEAMGMARRNEDRGLILERAAAVRTVESLRFVVPYLDDPALSAAACRTVVELAHHKGLREPNKGEFHPALEKTIAICKDPQLVDRARRYLQGI